MELYYKSNKRTELTKCGEAAADKAFNLPLDAVHPPGSEIFVKPKQEKLVIEFLAII